MPQLNLPGRCAARLIVTREPEDRPRIEGYGAVFYRDSDPGTEYWLWDDVVERIRPGAFDRALREDDVRSFFNHDPNLILGRNTAKTLWLSVDERGLKYSVSPPDTPAANAVIASVARGDVSGSSFMFEPLRATWEEVKRDKDILFIRNIDEVRLWEVGPVAFPAYESTTAGTRGESRSGPAANPECAAYRSWRESHVAAAREELRNFLADRDRTTQQQARARRDRAARAARL
jgi:hypothetical protein